MSAAILFALCVISLAVGWRYSREKVENRWFHQFSASTLWCKWLDGEVQVYLADGVLARKDPDALKEWEIHSGRSLAGQLDENRQRHIEQGSIGAIEFGFSSPYWALHNKC